MSNSFCESEVFSNYHEVTSIDECHEIETSTSFTADDYIIIYAPSFVVFLVYLGKI